MAALQWQGSGARQAARQPQAGTPVPPIERHLLHEKIFSKLIDPPRLYYRVHREKWGAGRMKPSARPNSGERDTAHRAVATPEGTDGSASHPYQRPQRAPH